MVTLEISTQDKYQRELMKAVGIHPLTVSSLRNTIPSLLRNRRRTNLNWAAKCNAYPDWRASIWNRQYPAESLERTLANIFYDCRSEKIFWTIEDEQTYNPVRLSCTDLGFKEFVAKHLPQAPEIFSSGAIQSITLS